MAKKYVQVVDRGGNPSVIAYSTFRLLSYNKETNLYGKKFLKIGETDDPNDLSGGKAKSISFTPPEVDPKNLEFDTGGEQPRENVGPEAPVNTPVVQEPETPVDDDKGEPEVQVPTQSDFEALEIPNEVINMLKEAGVTDKGALANYNPDGLKLLLSQNGMSQHADMVETWIDLAKG